MRWMIAILGVWAGTAGADARECVDGSSAVLSVSDWSAKSDGTGFLESVQIRAVIQNETDTTYRMVEGRIFFDDVLGRGIVNIELEPDIRIPSRQSVAQASYYSGPADIGRLPVIAPEDVVVTACVTAAVDADGNVIRFE